MNDEAEGLLASCLFLASTDLIIQADALYAEAVRVEARNPPWARNRRRKADRLMGKARRMCGERGLPWGIK